MSADTSVGHSGPGMVAGGAQGERRQRPQGPLWQAGALGAARAESMAASPVALRARSRQVVLP